MYDFGFQERIHQLHASTGFLHRTAELFIHVLTSLSELEIAREQVQITLPVDIWEQLQKELPFAIGSEFITYEWVQNIFVHLHEVFCREIRRYEGSVKLYLAEKNQNLKVAERIFFHLVESKDEDFPFAFLATYATKDTEGRIRHMPLRYALEEFKQERDRLLTLLSCLNKAAKTCDLLDSFIAHGELFHPLRLQTQEAYEILKHTEEIEACGILCRIPNWWRKKYASVSVTMKMGEKKPSLLGFDSLLSIQPEFSVDGVALTKEDIEQLLLQSEGLAFLKGKWVEVNHKKLQALLKQMENSENESITLMEALRTNPKEEEQAEDDISICNVEWLQSFLQSLRKPAEHQSDHVPATLQAVLRPYQKAGYSWLRQTQQVHFGACLADDMGLGKTLQVLSFLEELRLEKPDSKVLLIVPASLLGTGAVRVSISFTPKMDFHILHGKTSDKLCMDYEDLHVFLTITTYGMAAKLSCLKDEEWDCIILDEAQAIKNPLTKQTRALKGLKGAMRIAMTGTPIENDLSNLWSLFDLLNKGLLGTATEFKAFVNVWRNIRKDIKS